MKKINLIYQIQGEKVEEGIDVYELAPALLAIAELINESNKIIYPGGNEIGINIKPFEKGSFLIDIAVFAKTNLQTLINFAGGQDGENLRKLLELIGLISAGTAGSVMGLIKLIKLLKGKPAKVEKIEKNKIKFTSKEGNVFTVNGDVYNLYGNGKIINAVEKAYGKFLMHEGIDSVDSFVKGEENQKVQVERKDFSYFKEIAEDYKDDEEVAIDEIEINSDNETVSEIFVQPKRGSFEGDSRRWSFYEGSDKKRTITADIKDEDFLRQVRDGTLRPHHTDILKVKLKTIQKIKDQNIKTKYIILKVLKRIEAPKQMNF